MEKRKKQPQEFEEYVAFIENTRDGQFSKENVSFRELLQCTISREDVVFLDDNIQNVGTVLYGIH